MAQIIGLPKLSPTMEEGVLVRWVKKEGEAVEPGDLVAEVETDKANMDFNLEEAGTLLKLLVKEGDTVKLGSPVAILGEPGEDVTALVAEAKKRMGGGGAPAPDKKAASAAKPAAGEQAPAKAAKDARPDKAAVKAESGKAPISAKVKEPAAPRAQPAPEPSKSKREAARQAPAARASGGTTATAPSGGRTVLASPLAKTLALELGVDLRHVEGSGPGGRIIEQDVRAAVAGNGHHGAAQADADSDGDSEAEVDGEEWTTEGDEAEQPEVIGKRGEQRDSSTALALRSRAPMAVPGESDDYVDRPLSGMRKTIAERLTAAKRDIPHFRVTASFDPTAMLRFRERLNILIGDRGKVSINDLLLKGAALALRRVPEVNAAFVGDAIRYFTRVHMGVAVALERGLLTPVVRNADLKGIGVISAEVRDLVDRAKSRQLKAHEISGSTFTVSNLGMFGVDHFDAIINPPEAAILAVGRIQKIPVVEGERVVPGQRMSLTLSCDHRVVNGALGARFLDELIGILERPESLAL